VALVARLFGKQSNQIKGFIKRLGYKILKMKNGILAGLLQRFQLPQIRRLHG
jgi:hypothetical protein